MPKFPNPRPTDMELDERFMGFLYRMSSASHNFGHRYYFQLKKRGGQRGRRYHENYYNDEQHYTGEEPDYLETQRRRGFRDDDFRGPGAGGFAV